MNTLSFSKQKPAPLRVVFILNLFKIFLAAGLYLYFSTNNIQLGSVGPQIILYTMIAYIILFSGMVYAILKRNLWAVRVIVFLDLLASIPASAFAGLLISTISLALLFFNGPIKKYFA